MGSDSKMILKTILGFILVFETQSLRNLFIENILKCADEGLLYSNSNEGCLEPLEQGLCNDGSILVLNNEGIGQCEKRKCSDEDSVFFQGQCINIFASNSCNQAGQRLYHDLYGGSVCGCEQGWGRHDGNETCVQISKQGPCPAGDILSYNSRDSTCPVGQVCGDYNNCLGFLNEVQEMTELKAEGATEEHQAKIRKIQKEG